MTRKKSIKDMRQKVHLILLCAVLALMMGCTGSETSGCGSDVDSIYQWENIRKYILQEPDRAFAMVDTAQMWGVADVNYANWMRAQIHLAKGSLEDLDKAREYCLTILDNDNPAPDSLQLVKTYHLLISADQSDSRTWQDAIGYAIEGARISHEYGWTGDEAMFYFDAGDMMEKVQAGSGTEYLDRSLEMFRASSNIQALPTFSYYLGRVARLAINHEDWTRALELTQERVQVVDRIEKEYTTAPAGFIDQQRAYTYSLLAYCYYQTGDKTAAIRSAQAFEATQSSQSPDQQADILNYYIASGNKERISQICAVLEPYYLERLDTVSTDYASWLTLYAEALDKTGRSHEAYQQLGRHIALADSLVQRERQQETLKYAQQMRTQEKELQLKDEEAKTTIYRIISVSAILIILLIVYLLWRSYKYNKVLTEKNRRLLAEIEQREHEQQQAIEQLEAAPEAELTSGQQLYRRLCELMKQPDIFTDPDINQDTLARLLGTNRTYVYDALRECADQTPADFINSYRLRHASHLLATTKDSVALIAELCGLSRPTFYRLFSETYGMSPSDYRRVAKK